MAAVNALKALKTEKNVSRFKSRILQVGNVQLGGDLPVVVQSMTTTDTMDVAATVKQVKDLVRVGCQIVRITAPTVQDAEALKDIRARLRQDGCEVPLVADIHFLPAAAMIAADHVEKVRINPGNYADRKMFKVREYTDLEYQEELDRIHERFKPLVLKLKELGKALRIGTNHGSLSDRIMNRFGDTPEGMVESAVEFAEICRLYDFHNFCFSMKASNVGVMVRAYRLLVKRQLEKGWDYPIHLGVTEAGDGEDGRIKSAIGIGSLLAEGIGDTIRVSLTESSVNEIPVAKAIASSFPKTNESRLPCCERTEGYDSCRELPEVWMRASSIEEIERRLAKTSLRPDVIYIQDPQNLSDEFHMLKLQLKARLGIASPKVALKKQEAWWGDERVRARVLASTDYLIVESISEVYEGKSCVVLLDPFSETGFDPNRSILCLNSKNSGLDLIIEASTRLGSAFVDLNFKGILLEAPDAEESLRLSYGILQATRRRMSKTEYISCPSCGRTLFNLEETTARIKSITSHLKGVKIAIMGCIVNGPGEMADADFGYVGGAPGRVNLYVGKECVERNIPSEEAPGRLVELIRSHGRWVEPTL